MATRIGREQVIPCLYACGSGTSFKSPKTSPAFQLITMAPERGSTFPYICCIFVHPDLDSATLCGGIIVNRGKRLGRLVNLKEANKQAEIYVGRSLTLHIFCFMLVNCA